MTQARAERLVDRFIERRPAFAAYRAFLIQAVLDTGVTPTEYVVLVAA